MNFFFNFLNNWNDSLNRLPRYENYRTVRISGGDSPIDKARCICQKRAGRLVPDREGLSRTLLHRSEVELD